MGRFVRKNVRNILIKILRYKDIDVQKWNDCLAKIPFAHFYALHAYLSSICTWDAIVVSNKDGNYVGLLPLPFKKTFGIRYLSHPYFCQQLGYFSNQELSHSEAKKIVLLLKLNYLFGQTQWMENQIFTGKMHLNKRKNYELFLDKSFEEIKQNFNSNRTRVLKKLTKYDCKLVLSSDLKDIENCIVDMKLEIGDRFPEVVSEDYQNLTRALLSIAEDAKIQCVSAFISEEKACQSLFIEYNKRIVYLFGYTKENYVASGISSLTFLEILKQEQNSNKILDLEGGNIAGIERFFLSFGANQKNYYHVLLRPFCLEILKIVR